MADPILKFPPEQKGNPPARPRLKIAAEPRRRLMAAMRRYRRVLLLVVLPLAALIAGLIFYLNGGRYVTTDDAYVGAQKVLITPDVSGKIISVAVKEGQQVATGDILFQIDPVPFQLALAQARAKLDDAKTSHDNLVANVKLYGQTIELVNAGIALKQRDVERKSSLVKSNRPDRSSTSTTAPPRWSRRRPSCNSSGSRIRPPSISCSATPSCRSSSFRPTCRPRPCSTTPSATSI